MQTARLGTSLLGLASVAAGFQCFSIFFQLPQVVESRPMTLYQVAVPVTSCRHPPMRCIPLVRSSKIRMLPCTLMSRQPYQGCLASDSASAGCPTRNRCVSLSPRNACACACVCVCTMPSKPVSIYFKDDDVIERRCRVKRKTGVDWTRI